MKPISSNERVQLLDVLRGLAIFGMFTVNMTADIWWGDTYRELDLAIPDLTIADGWGDTNLDRLNGCGDHSPMESCSRWMNKSQI